jgi:hypothetical protein
MRSDELSKNSKIEVRIGIPLIRPIRESRCASGLPSTVVLNRMKSIFWREVMPSWSGHDTLDSN